MTVLVNLRLTDDRAIIVFDDGGRLVELSISAQTAATLVAELSRAVITLSPPNPAGVQWLSWPQMVRSSDVSFDIEAVAYGIVGIAVKLPGFLPLTVEIPSDSARAVAAAILEAADEGDRPKLGRAN